MHDLAALQAQRHDLEARLSQERPQADADRFLELAKRNPAFGSAIGNVAFLEKQLGDLKAKIAAAQEKVEAERFVTAFDEYRANLSAIAEGDAEQAAAKRALADAERTGAAALARLRAFNSRRGSEGYDHQIGTLEARGAHVPGIDPADRPALEAIQQHQREIDDLRLRLGRIQARNAALRSDYPVLEHVTLKEKVPA